MPYSSLCSCDFVNPNFYFLIPQCYYVTDYVTAHNYTVGQESYSIVSCSTRNTPLCDLCLVTLPLMLVKMVLGWIPQFRQIQKKKEDYQFHIHTIHQLSREFCHWELSLLPPLFCKSCLSQLLLFHHSNCKGQIILCNWFQHRFVHSRYFSFTE